MMFETATLECKICHWLRFTKYSLHLIVSGNVDSACPLCESKEYILMMGHDTDELFKQEHWRVTTFEPSHVVEETLKRNADTLRMEFYL